MRVHTFLGLFAAFVIGAAASGNTGNKRSIVEFMENNAASNLAGVIAEELEKIDEYSRSGGTCTGKEPAGMVDCVEQYYRPKNTWRPHKTVIALVKLIYASSLKYSFKESIEISANKIAFITKLVNGELDPKLPERDETILDMLRDAESLFGVKTIMCINRSLCPDRAAPSSGNPIDGSDHSVVDEAEKRKPQQQEDAQRISEDEALRKAAEHQGAGDESSTPLAVPRTPADDAIAEEKALESQTSRLKRVVGSVAEVWGLMRTVGIEATDAMTTVALLADYADLVQQICSHLDAITVAGADVGGMITQTLEQISIYVLDRSAEDAAAH